MFPELPVNIIIHLGMSDDVLLNWMLKKGYKLMCHEHAVLCSERIILQNIAIETQIF